MGVKRYELSERQRARISALLPGKAGDPGRTGADIRLFVIAACGCCAPGRTGRTSPSAMANGRRSTTASAAGATPGCGRGCSRRSPADRDNQYLMLDSTIVRAHQQAASGKGRPRIRRWGRSRGGLTTMIHLPADALGRSLRLLVTAGQCGDVPHTEALLKGNSRRFVSPACADRRPKPGDPKGRPAFC